MASDLREKLEELVERWRWNARNERTGWPEAPGLLFAADDLEAILAETEEFPERHKAKFLYATPGCGKDHGGGAWNANCTDCEAKAKLPLGHEFDPIYHTARDAQGERCAICGQPRSAHEPK